MSFFSRLNRPWVHFIVLGVLLFYLQGVFLPEPKPVVGPLSEAYRPSVVAVLSP